MVPPGCRVEERTYVPLVVLGWIMMAAIGLAAERCQSLYILSSPKATSLLLGKYHHHVIQEEIMAMTGEITSPMLQLLRGAAGFMTTDFTWKLNTSSLAYSYCFSIFAFP